MFAAISNMSVPLLTDFALGSLMGTEPKMLDEVLCTHTPRNGRLPMTMGLISSQNSALGIYSIYQQVKHQSLTHSLIFKEKLSANGNINLWCVQLVAGGHRQTYGVNYKEMFATAAKMLSICVVLGNSTQQDWEIHQVDVKSAYLNAPLKEEVYMVPPAGLLTPGEEGFICKLKKVLYGLKQAGCKWQKILTVVMMNDLGFKCSAVNHSVYLRQSRNEHMIIMVVTDDMVVMIHHELYRTFYFNDLSLTSLMSSTHQQ